MINIKSDSRKVKKGDIFVALDGISSNGSDYIDNAIKNGASTIVCKEGNYSVNTINVDDTKKYLNDYLVENYGKYLNEMTIIGITGTNGKTTSAYLIYQALNMLGRKCAYIGTIGFYMDKKISNLVNTSMATCELYDMLMECYENDYKCVIMEVSSQGLAYNRFDTFNFDYAIFTNLTEDHLDFHKTMEAYALAKKKLFDKLKSNGVSIVNTDDSYYTYFVTKNTVTYGFGKQDFNVINYHLYPNKTTVIIEKDNHNYEFEYKLIGKYNIYNILACISLLFTMKYQYDEIYKTIKKIKNPDGRMETIEFNNNIIIIDYAHTSDAMDNIFKTLKPLAKGRIITVFGCTGSREKEKRPVMMQLALKNSDYVFVTSDDLHEEEFDDIVDDMLNGNTKEHYRVIENRGIAIKEGMKMLKNNDMLLILGKGHEEVIIVKDKRIPFNDKKEVMKLIDLYEKEPTMV